MGTSGGQLSEPTPFPYIGSMPVDQITASDVLGLLEPVWVAKPETASRVRQRVESVMDLAVLSGWRPQMDNPASRALLRVLPAAKRTKEHHTALGYEAVPSALHKVGLSTCYPLTKLAFRLLVLAATRSGEVRGADWSEIDLETRTWVIPSHRMKAGREHRIPLSTQSTDTLRDAWVISGPDGLIFPAPRSGGVLSRYDPHAVAEAAGDSPQPFTVSGPAFEIGRLKSPAQAGPWLSPH